MRYLLVLPPLFVVHSAWGKPGFRPQGGSYECRNYPAGSAARATCVADAIKRLADSASGKRDARKPASSTKPSSNSTTQTGNTGASPTAAGSPKVFPGAKKQPQDSRTEPRSQSPQMPALPSMPSLPPSSPGAGSSSPTPSPAGPSSPSPASAGPGPAAGSPSGPSGPPGAAPDSGLLIPPNSTPPQSLLNCLVAVDVEYYTSEDAAERSKGKIVVNSDVEEDVKGLFKLIAEIKFPMTSVKPINEFGWNDNASMAADNTSGYNYRRTPNGGVSWHASGLAVDINTKCNPYMKPDGSTLPPGARYDKSAKCSLSMENEKGRQIIEYMQSKGWRWGGTFHGNKDYQHFDKAQARGRASTGGATYCKNPRQDTAPTGRGPATRPAAWGGYGGSGGPSTAR